MPLRRIARITAAALALLAGTGCAAAPSGALYTNVTRPLDLNLDRTPAHTGVQPQDSNNTFQFYVRIQWGSDGIGDVAKREGFTRIHYADLQTLTILGIWTQRWVHVYGER